MTCTCRLFATPPPITVTGPPFQFAPVRRTPLPTGCARRAARSSPSCHPSCRPRYRIKQAAPPDRSPARPRAEPRPHGLRSKQADRAPPACVILLCFRSPCKSLRFPFPSPSRKRPPRPSRVAYVAPLCNLPRTARARASLGHTPRASPYKNGGAPRVAGQLTL